LTVSWISFKILTIVVCYIFVCIFCRLLTFIYSFLPLFGRISNIWVSNSLELDQTPNNSASDQAPRCLQMLLHLRFFTLQSFKGYLKQYSQTYLTFCIHYWFLLNEISDYQWGKQSTLCAYERMWLIISTWNLSWAQGLTNFCLQLIVQHQFYYSFQWNIKTSSAATICGQ